MSLEIITAEAMGHQPFGIRLWTYSPNSRERAEFLWGFEYRPIQNSGHYSRQDSKEFVFEGKSGTLYLNRGLESKDLKDGATFFGNIDMRKILLGDSLYSNLRFKSFFKLLNEAALNGTLSEGAYIGVVKTLNSRYMELIDWPVEHGILKLSPLETKYDFLMFVLMHPTIISDFRDIMLLDPTIRDYVEKSREFSQRNLLERIKTRFMPHRFSHRQ